MRQILKILTLITLTSCYQNEEKKRDAGVYIDGEKVEIITTTNSDSIDSKPDTSYYYNQKLKSISGSGIVQVDSTMHEIVIDNPIAVINRIFTNYNKYQESTDSPSNLDSLSAALKELESNIDSKDLTLVVDVWLYYTVTDFSTREKTEKVLLSHRQESIKAVKERMKNKKEWESEGGAPFSELEYLLKQLENE